MSDNRYRWPGWEDSSALRAYLLKVLEVTVLLVFMFVAMALFVRALTYILPFIIGFAIAVVLLPITRTLERAGLSRRSSIIITLAVVIGLIVALAGFLIVQGAEETAGLIQVLPHYLSSWKVWSLTTIQKGMAMYGHLPPKLVGAMQSTFTSAIDQLRQFLMSFFSGVFADVALLPDFIVIVIISVIASYFFMADRDVLIHGLRRMLPPGWAPKLEGVAGDVGKALAGLFRAQLILILVTSVICVFGLALMRIPYALILGMLIGLTGWVPIVGSGIVTFPWAIGALAFGNYILAIKILLLQAIASLVRHTIEPKLLASNMGLGTFATLFGMYVGLTSIGVLGLLLGPIVLIATRSLIRARMFVDFFPTETVDQKLIVPKKDS